MDAVATYTLVRNTTVQMRPRLRRNAGSFRRCRVEKTVYCFSNRCDSGSHFVRAMATPSHKRLMRYTSRQERSPRSASGRAITAVPAPKPLNIASMPVANAREFLGISSMAMTAMRMSSVRPKGRPMVCVATSAGNDGASAPNAHTMGATHATTSIRGRRPRLSARTTRGRQMRMPHRTTAAPMPWPDVATPNSSAA